MANSDNQNRFIKGAVSKHGFIKTSASAIRSISTQSEKIIFSTGEDNSVATSLTKATATAAKTAVATAYTTYKTAYKTAYITHKTSSAIKNNVINVTSGAVKFAKNPVMSDGEKYRKHLKTKVVSRVKNLKPVRAFTITKNGVKTATGTVRKTFRVTKRIARGEIKVTKM